MLRTKRSGATCAFNHGTMKLTNAPITNNEGVETAGSIANFIDGTLIRREGGHQSVQRRNRASESAEIL